VGYHWLLFLAARAYGGFEGLRPTVPKTRFAVVVPAHDEAAHIGKTLESLAGLDYPADLRRVTVVADNCTDRTASMVRSSGIRCLERTDPKLRGKGHALEYAFATVLAEGVDAVVVVDADTRVAPNLLRAMDARLREGQRAVQSLYGVSNPEDGPLPALLAVGNAMENDLFRGKEALGLPVLLRGNGMCLSAGLLREHPWQAHSVVEDTEYGLDLVRAGERVRFAPETRVDADAPGTLAQLKAQRVRWASGNSRLGKRLALTLLATGLRGRDAALADAGWFLLARGKSLLLLGGVLCAAAGAAGAVPPVAGFAPLALMAAHFLLQALMDGVTWRRLGLLALAPAYLVWLMGISLAGLAEYRGAVWVRTGRS
jgi:hypothetical protein